MPICNIISYPGLTPYGEALAQQYELLEQRRLGLIPDTLLLLEHPPTITLGRGSRESDLLSSRADLELRGISIAEIDRGGEITYHAPGQLVGYPILDLNGHGKDLHKYLRGLEEVIICVLAHYEIQGTRKTGLTGVWVREQKIAAIGIKVRQWITMHGFAFNVNMDLSPLRNDIVPCGIREYGVTSMAEELPGEPPSRMSIEENIAAAFSKQFDLTLRLIKPVV